MHSDSTTNHTAWLKQFLLHRGVAQPDQRPLYAYQCTSSEYNSLLTHLECFRDEKIRLKTREAQAIFVLFCAEWYRREYVKDVGWSWEGIWQRLEFRLEQKAIEDVVEGGLVFYWKRPLHHYNSARNFLGSVFSEGGLPFNELRRDDGRFKRLFENILTQYDQARLGGHETRELVEQQLDRAHLPEVFSRPASVELVAGMADQLIALVVNHDLSHIEDPVAHLDTRNPRWREQFPLPLDDETGSKLLNNLLSQATTESKKRKRYDDEWRCRFVWQSHYPDSLATEINLPEEISFQLDNMPSTTRFDLAVVEGSRIIQSLGPGYAKIQENLSAQVKPRIRKIFLKKRKRPDLPLSVVAMTGGTTIATIPLDNSAIVPGEVPLGLEQENGNWQLCGQASFRSKSEELLLILPEGCGIDDIEVIEGTPDIESINPILGLMAATIRGKSQLRIVKEETYRIQTGHSGSNPELELSGNIFDWPTQPAFAFVGLPKPQWKPSSGTPQQHDCTLYIGSRSAKEMPLPEVLGSRYVTVRNRDGDSLLRRKVGILPPDLKLELRSENVMGKGRITVRTSHNCLFKIKNDTIHVEKIKYADKIDLVLSANDLPPPEIILQVTPCLLADPVELILPYPGVGCFGFDAEGRTLSKRLSVKELLGSRLFLFGKTREVTYFTLTLSLRGHSRGMIYDQWNYRVKEKPVEISLYSLREKILNLLSLDADIDQRVELSVQSPVMKEIQYFIYLHSTWLELDPAHNLLSAANRAGIDATKLEPVLMLLTDPQQKSQKLIQRTSQGTPVGDFELPQEIDKNGPWLIVPATADSISFRPYFLPGQIEDDFSHRPLNSLQAAVRAFNPEEEPNPFFEVFDAMADNPLHSGWEFLSNLFKHYAYLPLVSFEAWKALVRHPQALIISLLKFEMDPDYLGKIEASFPILWEFFPLKYFQTAIATFRRLLAENGIARESIDTLIERRFEQFGRVVPSFSGTLENFLVNETLDRDLQLPPETIEYYAKNDWYQDLIRNRLDAKWPEYNGEQLQQWYFQQEKTIIRIDSVMNYRNAVVYLPMFAAAVASGDASFTDIFNEHDVETVFSIRKIRDFDSTWFNSIYQYCLLRRITDT